MKLAPRHHSALKRKSPLRPSGLSCTLLPDETRMFIEAETLDIYARMVNAGCSLQQTLSAIYLSGMNAAMEAQK